MKEAHWWIAAATFGWAAASPTYAAESAANSTVLDPVTVTGNRDGGLLGERIDTLDAPVDIRTIGPSAIRQPGNRSLASLLSRDASIGENYATTGYYQNFTIRGFTLDLGSAYRINGFIVPAEFDIPLDNVDSVQILEGVAGLHGGTVGAGGSINFITRRPGAANSLRTVLDSRGGRLVSVEVGSNGRSGVGVLFNVAHADLRPEQPKAGGSRDLLSIATDVRFASNLLLQADLIAQRHVQPAVPGFQLLGGTTLPDLSLRDVNINRQPWSRPVSNRGAMADVRVNWQLSESLWVEGGVARTVALIDDNLATPSGCNSTPVQYFCSNGDYALYDYHASERREGTHIMATLHASIRTGFVAHAATVGIERIDRTIHQNELYSATIYDAAGNALTGNLRSSAVPLAAPVGIGVDQPRRRATQTGGFVSDRLSTGSFDLFAAVRLVEIAQQPEVSQGHRTLPQIAASWRIAPGQSVYAARATGLEFGSEAPLTAANAGVLLAPRSTQQEEVGWKGQQGSGAQWALTAFRMRRPYEFTLPTGSSFAGLGDYVRRGTQTNSGLSLAGATPAGRSLRFEGSLAMLRASASGTGFASYDGVQIQNVSRLSSFVRAIWAPSALPAEFSLAWTERSRRNARRDGVASVPGYATFDSGASWHGTVSGRPVNVAVSIRNLTDRRYWRDVGEAYSADLLFPGASRSAAILAQVDF